MSNRAADDLKADLLDAKLKLDGLRGNTTTVHPFLVTELVIKDRRGDVIRSIKMTGR